MSNDGKDKFYRMLNLSKEDEKLLGWFRKIKKQLMNDEIKENEIIESQD